MAEVFAGYVEYTDDQVGRVVDFLESSGELDNTIIVVVSDNGASGEGGPNGTFNEWRFFNGVPTPTELTPRSTSTSWAARSPTTTTTPGGPGRSTPRSRTGSGGRATRAASPTCAWCRGRPRCPPTTAVRSQYVHAVDVVPTIYDLIGITPPETLNGYEQRPIEGESFAASLTDAGRAGQAHPVLRDARPAGALRGRLAGLHRCTRR